MADASANAASMASAAEPSTSGVDSSKLQYLEQKYGSKAAHVHLSQPEVDAMVDKVLQDSPTVQYLLASLKMVSDTVGFFPASQHVGGWRCHLVHATLVVGSYCRVFWLQAAATANEPIVRR
jgi:hypothetical protein